MTLRDLHFQNPNTFLYKKRGSLDFEPLGDLHFFGGLRPGFRGWGSYLRGLVSISVLYHLIYTSNGYCQESFQVSKMKLLQVLLGLFVVGNAFSFLFMFL